MRSIWTRVPVLAAIAGVILITASPAGAAQPTVTDNVIAGNETAVSCPTPSLCVAVGSYGSRPSRGVVVTLTNGKQTHAAVLRGSSVIDTVGCRKSGCWALGRLARGGGVYLVKISSAGRPVSEQTVRVPGGTGLNTIWCASMKSCEIVGADNGISPSAIEIGIWNGTKLRLHPVTVKDSKRIRIAALSCWHSACEAVGEDLAGPGYTAAHGLILAFTGQRPEKLNADSGYPSLNGLACISPKTCYAAGGSVVTVTRGAATHSQSSGSGYVGLYAIECRASECETAGTFLKPQNSTSDGWLQSLTNGVLGATVDDAASYGFTAIAGRGSSGFIALGPSAKATPGTDVAVG